MEDDWDLHAVVRGCAAITSTTTTTSSAGAATSFSTAVTNNTTCCGQVSSTFQQDCNFTSSCFQDLFEPRRESFVQEELHDLYKPFFPKSQDSSQILLSPQSLPISPLSVLGGLQDLPYEQQQQQIMKQLPQQTQLRQKQQSFSVSNGSKASVSHNPSPRSKRRYSYLHILYFCFSFLL